jgi:hypothetical protein
MVFKRVVFSIIKLALVGFNPFLVNSFHFIQGKTGIFLAIFWMSPWLISMGGRLLSGK